MMKRPIYILLLLFFALAFISWIGSGGSLGRRGIACVDPVPQVILPLEDQLFGHISDQAVRSNALQYYAFFTQVEMNAINDLQNARSVYGLPGFSVANSSIYAPPSIVNFSVGSNLGFHQGGWGMIPGSETVARNFIAEVPQRSGLNFGH